MIGKKMLFSIYTKKYSPNEALEDWEFLGPSIIWLFISSFVAWGEYNRKATVFASMLTIIFFGIMFASFTISSLSNNIGMFNAAAILSYMISIFVPITFLTIWLPWYLNLILIVGGSVLCVFATLRLIVPKLPEEKKVLGMFTLFFLLFVFDWILLVSSSLPYQ